MLVAAAKRAFHQHHARGQVFLNHRVTQKIAAGIVRQVHLHAHALADLNILHLRAAAHADRLAAILQRRVVVAARGHVRVRP